MLADFRFAWRSIWNNPGFAVVAILALALGIGANTAVFTIVRFAVLKPLPFHEPDRLFHIWETHPRGRGVTSALNLRDWREQQQSFTSLASYSNVTRNLQGIGQPERLRATAVSANLFQIIGLDAQLGRTLAEGEDEPEAPNVAVLASSLWKRRFGGDRAVIGRTVILDGAPHTIIGVMPDAFDFPVGTSHSEIWVPQKPAAVQKESRRTRGQFCLGRLKPQVTAAAAQAEMSAIAARLESAYPDELKNHGAQVESLRESVSGKVRPVLMVLLAAVGLVLLIACVNVANLLLARGAARQREVAIRTAMGAQRGQLVRLLLTESFLLAALGVALAAVVSLLATPALTALTAKSLPRMSEVGLDLNVFLFLVVTGLLTALVFGLLPAWRVSRTDLNSGLREGGGRGAVAGPSRKLRSALVGAELALAFILLIGAGALIKLFLGLMNVDPGLNPHNVLTFSVAPPDERYPPGPPTVRFFQHVLDRLRILPGVRAAGAINLLPLDQWGFIGQIEIAGRPPGQSARVEMRIVTPGYFAALNIPIVRGRDLPEPEAGESRQVVLVNQAFVKRYLSNLDPLTTRIGSDPDWLQIVGVAGDVRQAGLDRQPSPEIYITLNQPRRPIPMTDMTIVVRSDMKSESLVQAARAAVQAVDSEVPVFGIKTMDMVIADSVSPQRVNLTLMAAFAGLALILASAGIYSVMSYLVNQRVQEFGVRVALGATASDLFTLILRETALIAACGMAVGIAGSLGAVKLMQKFIPGVSAADPLTFVAVALILSVSVFAATVAPARRAMQVDPVTALRAD